MLSSGGIDSTVQLAIAISELGKENVMSLSIDYGQKHTIELDHAEMIAQYYGVKHRIMSLSEFFSESDCPLLAASSTDVPDVDAASNRPESEKMKPLDTFVPFRNGIFLSAAASYALTQFIDEDVTVYSGEHANENEAIAYPDTSPDFINAMSQAIFLGTGKRVKVVTNFAHLSKTEIVRKGIELKVPFKLTYSCYNGREKSCGKCCSCGDRLFAFKMNGIVDPIEYEESNFSNDT